MLKRLAFVAGAIGVVTGSTILGYLWMGDEIPPRELVLMMLGLAIGLTGVAHVVGGIVVAAPGGVVAQRLDTANPERQLRR